MFIVPLSDAIPPVQSLFEKSGSQTAISETRDGFTSLFKDIFAEVQDTHRVTAEDNVKMVMGEIDDLHTLYNNTTKAAISIEAFVAVKNAAIDSYEKIMNIQI